MAPLKVMKRKRKIEKVENKISELDILYNTNIFKLQCDEIKKENEVNKDEIYKIFNEIKLQILKIPSISSILLKDFNSNLIKKNIIFPFDISKLKNIDISLNQFDIINIGGSFRYGGYLKKESVDILIKLPFEFDKNMIKNKVYCILRAAYLCHIVEYLMLFSDDYKFMFNIEFSCKFFPYLNLWSNKYNINFILRPFVSYLPSLNFDIFLPTHNCCTMAVKNKENSVVTEFYNQYIVRDIIGEDDDEKILSENIKISLLLLKKWIKLRPFSISGYEIKCLLKYIEMKKLINQYMTPYQIIRVVLNFISIELKNNGLSLIKEENEERIKLFKKYFHTVLLHRNRFYNILFALSENDLNLMIFESKRALTNLSIVGHYGLLSFSEVFMKNIKFECYFDNLINIRMCDIKWLNSVSNELDIKRKFDVQYTDLEACSIALYNILKDGLVDFIWNLSYKNNKVELWNVNTKQPETSNEIVFGLIINPSCLYKTSLIGPVVNDPNAIKFRKLFGINSKVMKLIDGSLHEVVNLKKYSLSKLNNSPTYEQIVRMLLQIHCNLKQNQVIFWGNEYDFMIKSENSLLKLSNKDRYLYLNKRFNELCNIIKKIQINEFKIISIKPISSTFSNTAAHNDIYNLSYKHKININIKKCSYFSDDLDGHENSEKLVLAIIGSIFDKYKFTYILENDKIILSFHKYIFEIHVYSLRKLKIIYSLQRTIPEYISLYRSLSCDMYYKHMHLEFIKLYVDKYENFISSCRLFKRWIGSQLLSSHIPEQVCELLVAYVFNQPFSSSNNAHSAFLQTLYLLANYNFTYSVLVLISNEQCNLNDIHVQNIENLELQLKNNRSLLPSLVIYTPYDSTGICFSYNISAVVFNRLTKLAQVSYHIITSTWSNDKIHFSPFKVNLDDFDIIIELSQDQATTTTSSNQCSVLYDTREQVFMRTLIEFYSDMIEFFSDHYTTNLICGVFKCRLDTSFNINIKNCLHKSIIKKDESMCIINKTRLESDIRLIDPFICKKITINSL